MFRLLWNTKAMSQKQLILHVGFHKSGTTALQESFYVQREQLATAGIFYPSQGKKAHHRVAWALAGKRWGWKARGGETTPYRVWSRMISLINRTKHNKVLLSSEFFSEFSLEKIQELARSIKHRQVKVLFTLRSLAKLLGSSYQQYLKYGTKEDYSGWLHSVLDVPGKSKINPTFWKRHMHGDVIARWAEVFGAENVSVIIVDEQKPELLFESINDYLGLAPGILSSQATGSNRSLSMEEISLLLELNRKFPETRTWPEYLTFIRNGYVRELTDHVLLKEGKAKLPTPSWAVEKANGLGSISKDKIKQSGVRVYGDIESLDSARVLEGEPNYPDSIDIETVAQAMLVFNARSIRRFPIGWVVRALKTKIKQVLVRAN